jgi:hypothetical protein
MAPGRMPLRGQIARRIPRRISHRIPHRSLGALAVALLLAVGLAVSPMSTGVAVAANPLRVQAEASYTLDPGARRVHVAIHYEVTDLKPDSAQFTYYYTGYTFAIQPEARNVRASDSRGALSVKTKAHEFYVETTVTFRSNLFYRQTAKFAVRYDLVGGAPRSSSSIRIGRAFSTFGVWAWGDAGRGSVVVRTPQGFGDQVVGDPMSTSSSGGAETLRATPADPEAFYAIVSAENPLAYTSDRLSLDGGVEIVVMAWPEDHAWDDTVAKTLRTAMPKLRELIGLDWPVAHDLNVRERYTPALEGYAGVFFTESQRIDVSEDLDPVVIVHEVSHAWLNGDLFVERWIYEGLAQEYAWRVQTAVGGPAGAAPSRPELDDPGYVRLESWTFPEVIRDQETDDHERFGYQASFWVIDQVVRSVGVEQMREAFANAEANLTAYPGAGTPEAVGRIDSWRRFLDLAQSIDRPDQIDLVKAFADFVLRENDVDDLINRADARDQYRLLLIDGDGWLPGWYVREPMGEWRFDVAEKRMTEATAVLALRTQVGAAAGALGLESNGALKTAYEGATNGFNAATSLAHGELDALAAIAEAKANVEAEPDLLTTIGLLGETPGASYAAARDAFQRGDVAGARASAAAAAALVTGAAAVGQGRLLLAIAVAIALLVLLVIVAVAARRRRRRRALALAALAGSFGSVVAGSLEPGATEPYATLAADPEAAPAAPTERPPDADGGFGPA